MPIPHAFSTTHILPAAGDKDGKLDGKVSWWRYPLPDIMLMLETRAEGLSASQVRERFARYGKNRFADVPVSHLLLRFIKRFGNPLILLLLFAGAVSAATGESVSAVIIAAIVIVSVSLDFIQEYRAEKTAQRLKQSVALRAVVMREGSEREIAADDIVRSCMPGNWCQPMGGC